MEKLREFEFSKLATRTLLPAEISRSKEVYETHKVSLMSNSSTQLPAPRQHHSHTCANISDITSSEADHRQREIFSVPQYIIIAHKDQFCCPNAINTLCKRGLERKQKNIKTQNEKCILEVIYI